MKTFLDKIKNVYKDVNGKVMQYILSHIVFLVATTLMDFGLLLAISKGFDVQIKRGLMLSYVFIFEIIIMFYLKKRYLNKESLIKKLQENKLEEYYSDLFVYGYKNATHTFYFVIPFLIAYGTIKDAEILYYINTGISLLVLPMISVIVSMILPDDVSLTTSKFVRSVKRLVTNIITILVYVIFCLVLKDIIASYYPANFFSFDLINRILNIPISLNFDLMEMSDTFIQTSSVFTGLVSKNIFEFTVIIAMVAILFKVADVIYKIIKTVKINLLKGTTPYSEIKRNNTRVFRINFNIMYCMPRSPDCI